MTLPASRGSDGTVIAENDGVTYSVSPKIFLVSEGDNVIYRDSWIELVQPGFSGSSTSSASTIGDHLRQRDHDGEHHHRHRDDVGDAHLEVGRLSLVRCCGRR